MILVVSLPHKDVASYYGAKALTSVSKHGAYVQYQNHFYELFVDVDTSSWKWIVMEKELGNAVYGPVMMYLPPEYTCRPFWNQTYRLISNITNSILNSKASFISKEKLALALKMQKCMCGLLCFKICIYLYTINKNQEWKVCINLWN